MVETWNYSNDKSQTVAFEISEDGTVDVFVVRNNRSISFTGLPYEEFRALAAVMNEQHLAWQARRETKPGAKLVREVMALSGLNPSLLAGLVGRSMGVNTINLWLAGSGTYKLYKDRLQRLKAAFVMMEFDPHLGRRQAVFKGVTLSLYEELRRELPRTTPIN